MSNIVEVSKPFPETAADRKLVFQFGVTFEADS